MNSPYYENIINVCNQFNILQDDIDILKHSLLKNNIDIKYLSNTLTYLYHIYDKKYIIYIECNNKNCIKCLTKQCKLKYYYKSNRNIRPLLYENYKNNQKKYKQNIKNILNVKIPYDIIDKILSYNKNTDNCKYIKKIYTYFNNMTHYNIMYMLLVNNNKIDKYFKLTKFCTLNNNCITCKILYRILVELIENIDHSSKYVSCDYFEILDDIKEHGFSYYTYYHNYEVSKNINICDYSYINPEYIYKYTTSEDHMYFQSEVDPIYFDFWN